MSLAISYHMKRKDKKMAKGGSIEDAHQKQEGVNLPVHSGSGKAGSSMAGLLAKKHPQIARGMHADKLEELKKMKSPKLPMAEGGDVCMHCGGAMMAEGGELADFDSADFDAGGFEGKEANYTGANSGDELSTEGEEERKKSILSRILASRTKKAGHNPRPD